MEKHPLMIMEDNATFVFLNPFNALRTLFNNLILFIQLQKNFAQQQNIKRFVTHYINVATSNRVAFCIYITQYIKNNVTTDKKYTCQLGVLLQVSKRSIC